MRKFQCVRRGKVSPTWLGLGPHLSPDSFQAAQKHQGIQHIPSEPGDRLLSALLFWVHSFQKKMLVGYQIPAQVWGQVNTDSLPTTLALLRSLNHKQDGFISIQVLPPTVPSP